jgi:hypothetical protein
MISLCREADEAALEPLAPDPLVYPAEDPTDAAGDPYESRADEPALPRGGICTTLSIGERLGGM